MNSPRQLPSSRSSAIPAVPGLPLIGNAPDFLRRPLGFLVDAHHNHGPVFRMQVPMTKAVVVAGALADELLRQGREPQMSREGLFRPFRTEVGVDVFEAFGEPHRRARGLLRHPYSRKIAAQFLPEIDGIVGDVVQEWHAGERIDLFEQCARLSLLSAMRIVTPVYLGSIADDIRAAGSAVMYAAFRLAPYVALKNPLYRRSQRRMVEVVDEMIRRHARGELADEPKTHMIDACLSATNAAGDRMDERAIRGACFYALAGTEIYIGRLIGFLLFELLRNRSYLVKVLGELPEAAEAIREGKAKKMTPHLHAAYSEALRRYPLIPAYPYTPLEDTRIGAYSIREGQLLLFAPHTAHFSHEHFANPMAFEPERHLPPRREEGPTPLFASFGTGSHACSAQGFVETIALGVLTSLLRRVDLELTHPSYLMELRMTPLIAPRTPVEVRVASKLARGD